MKNSAPKARATIFSFYLACAICLSACGPAGTPVKNTPPPPKPAASAENFLTSHQYTAAAEEFWRLSSQAESAQQSERYAMRAALAYVDANQISQAAAIISATAVSDSVAIRLATLASAAIGEKSPDNVYSPNDVILKLETIEARTLTPYQKGFYYRTLGNAQYKLANFTAAATSFNAALRHAQPLEEQPSIHQLLWQSVNRLEQTGRSDLITNGDKNLIGWLALKDSTDSVLHDAAALNGAISNWQAQFPSHPANVMIVEQLYEISESLSRKASHIALLLPFDGRYKEAAEAIRNGFLSAWFDDQDSRKPIVSVHSVTVETVADAYRNAIERGADFVVGPLEKQTIESLLTTTKLTAPIFLLNRVEPEMLNAISANPDLAYKAENVYQFALSPEDEADSIARHIWEQGFRRVAAIGPDSNLGNRLLSAFSQQWEALGGEVLRSVEYSGDQSRYSEAVRKAFNLDFSSARAKQLTAIVGRRVFHNPRARKDIDAIFLAGLPVDNRQLIPQLRYYGVANVPMYSSSHTYTGSMDPDNDIDLDGARFGDMPLVLQSDSNSSPYSRFRSNWPRLGPRATRMFAFGLDAYRMTNEAPKLRYRDGVSFSGATGKLTVLRSGEVIRDLKLAQFVDGVPVIVN
ncbi:MAG: penicillin-binding protein activator [Gammaproteobacteria bacterium]